ncbi:histidine/lysine/arginine/ornithine transporter subunit; membrane component of ABC superfamily [Candidatus Terasakiella magnetica]|uniref:Histidine/lysine/arginine/ornithine transporter subunit membrane component of ABC superfamily n=1 Tax=Candidatus Terasakiella magnetica TaxID=1867952 RepID=A0A1C3RKF0_9PROT|nr:ABC transporter permease [Candidatus Terasakiella magnetica]SCA57800.1 histidine/lysine/arginine/ornithine transporter subunit; membrane component of ABC superfamily [Candidatus Terasakiella magnetica]
MNWEEIFIALPKLLDGALLTLELVFIACLVGFVIAIPVALMRSSQNWWLRNVPLVYTFFFRGTPLLVQLFLFYYGAAQFEAVRESIFWVVLKEAYWCALIVFALNTGAYTAEIFRGAIRAVPHGEVEAGIAIGMKKHTLYRRVVLPRAIRMALPAYGNEIILMLKSSALAYTITLLDLTGVTRTIIARNYLAIEMYFTAGVIYLLMTFIFIQVWMRVEKRLLRFQ